ncbi:hypothetical protein [Enterococcus faecium]|uniref:hypothetical protein n=1 Tax=Enterococcus faecium TaxID=1352 RepID=UPI001E60661F|nr:hypothetical protein [Enterococcus faecium]
MKKPLSFKKKEEIDENCFSTIFEILAYHQCQLTEHHLSRNLTHNILLSKIRLMAVTCHGLIFIAKPTLL